MKKIYILKYTVLLVATVIGLIVTSCGTKEDTTAQESVQTATTLELSQEQFTMANIQLGKVEQRTMGGTIQVNGILDVPPQNLVSVSALLGGYVKSTDLLQGMSVRKGQLLAVIQNPEYLTLQQDYLESKSKLEYLRLDYERQKELAAEQVGAAKVFQQATSDYQSLQARVGGLEEKIRIMNINPATLSAQKISSLMNIYSPISGYVTVVNVNIGKYVTAQDVLFELVDTKHLHAELTVFEKDINKVKVGQKIKFTLVNESTRERSATVYLINRKINSDRTVRVHAHLDNEDSSLLPNMYLKASIETTNQQVWAVPEQAIVTSANKDYVFVQRSTTKDSKGFVFEMIQVKKGLAENGFIAVELVANLPINQPSIVVHGAYDLLSKMINTDE